MDAKFSPADPGPAPAPITKRDICKGFVNLLALLSPLVGWVSLGLILFMLFKPAPTPPGPGPDPSPDPTKPIVIPGPVVEREVDAGSLIALEADAAGPVWWYTRPCDESIVQIQRVSDKKAHVVIKSVTPAKGAAAVNNFWVAAISADRASVPLTWIHFKIGKDPGPGPGPGPGPNPPPPPPPPPPPSPIAPLNEFGKLVLPMAQKAAKPLEAKALAQNYIDVTSAIRAGGIQSREAAIEFLVPKNQAAVKDKQAWLGFFTWLDNELTVRDQKGVISTMAHRADHFEQIAAALIESTKGN